VFQKYLYLIITGGFGKGTEQKLSHCFRDVAPYGCTQPTTE